MYAYVCFIYYSILQQESWLQEKYNEICKGMTDLGQEAEEAEENKAELDAFQLLINVSHNS